jgi:predicted nucleic acid-binding protein
MLNSKTDERNIQLLKLLAQLRNHIDIHRIIGLNVAALQEGLISGALLGYLQMSAHESLAIYICKVFEASPRNDLNSIPGIIESIPTVPVSEMQGRELAAFGSKYGHGATPADARSYLKDTLVRFCIDPDDVPFVALALAEEHDGIWSNDRAFENLPGVQVWTTTSLKTHLGL